MADRLTADELDAIDARRDRNAFSTTSYQDAQALIDEVRASWAERDRLRDALRALAWLADEAKRYVPPGMDLDTDLEADLADVRTLLDGVARDDGMTDDEAADAFMAALAEMDGEPSEPEADDDGEVCVHEMVDTFASGAGRRVDVCMVCDRALRFWIDGEASDG